MIAAQPGAMKSMFTMAYVQALGLPALYFSADMDAHTATTRLVAALTGTPTDEIAEELSSGEINPYYLGVLDEQSKIHFAFDSSPTFQDIADELSAYAEIWSCYPAVIVFDNLLNLDAEQAGESYQGLLRSMAEIHRITRITGAAVIVLHHTSEAEGSPEYPPPRKAIQGKVTQLPEIVLTVAYRAATGEYRIAPVKNRNGPQDATGRTWARLTAYPERAMFGPLVASIGD